MLEDVLFELGDLGGVLVAASGSGRGLLDRDWWLFG